VVFVVIALASLARPHRMAEGLGYRLDSIDALSEFRAVYVGLWLATAALLLFAMLRVQHATYGDLGALLVLGQVVGRLVSLAVDGAPSGRIWPMFVLEAVGACALFLVRPNPSRDG
jgi:hypothetical protein